MVDATSQRAAAVYRGFFDLRWLEDDESVRSAGDRTGAVIDQRGRFLDTPASSNTLDVAQPIRLW